MSLDLGFFVPPVPPEQYIKMALRAEEVEWELKACPPWAGQSPRNRPAIHPKGTSCGAPVALQFRIEQI